MKKLPQYGHVCVRCGRNLKNVNWVGGYAFGHECLKFANALLIAHAKILEVPLTFAMVSTKFGDWKISNETNVAFQAIQGVGLAARMLSDFSVTPPEITLEVQLPTAKGWAIIASATS